MDASTITFVAHDSATAYDDTAAFWRAVDESGIPHHTEDVAEFGETVVTVRREYVAALSDIAARHGGHIETLA